MAIYRILDWDDMDSHKFLRFAERLPLYDGAVRRRLEIEYQNEEPIPSDDIEFAGNTTTSFSMAERYNQIQSEKNDGQEPDVLQLMNGSSGEFGDLFEYSTG